MPSRGPACAAQEVDPTLLPASALLRLGSDPPHRIAQIVGDEQRPLPILSQSERRAVQVLLVPGVEAANDNIRLAHGLALFDTDEGDCMPLSGEQSRLPCSLTSASPCYAAGSALGPQHAGGA